MSIIDEVKKMQQNGKTNQQISQELQQRGFSQKEISNTLSQAQIKSAISPEDPQYSNSSQQQQYAQPPRDPRQPQRQEFQNPDESYDDQSQYPEDYPQDYAGEYSEDYPGEYPPEYPPDFQQYAPPQPQISTDTVSEIAEQIVAEKMFKIRSQMEKVSEFRNAAESRIIQLNERLMRIEKIIDRLQLSILQKVGSHMSDVSDLKKELIETQKSFNALSKNKKNSSSEENKE